MSDRKSKKNQRLGSSRRGPKGFNRNIEKDDDDDGFQQIAESGDGQNQFHTTSDYHATQFDHPPSSSIEQQTSPLECPPHARSHKDLLKETELPERKRKMGSTRKSTGRFKGERNLDDMGTTEELDEEYVTQPNTSTTEEQHASLTEEQSNFPSDLSLQTKSSGFGKDSGTTLMFAVSENKEKGTIHHQEITSHSHEVVSDMPIDEAMGPSVHSIAVTVAECELLREDSVMFNEPKIFSHQETQKASTSGQKRRMGSTRRPLRGQNSENVGVQEHSQNMAENEKKAKVMGEAKLEMSEEMAQIWDDVARDDPSSHTESALLLSQSLLANRAEQKEPDVLAGTETMNQPVAFPLVDSEKPLPETSSHHGTPLLNEALDFKFGSHTEDLDVLNKVLKEAGGHLSDNSQHVSDTRKDTNPSYDFRDENTETKKEVLKQKEETQLEELALHDQESSLGQHDIATTNNYDGSMVQRIVGGSRSFDMPVSNISHAVPPKTNFPHEMRDVVEERQEIHIEMKQDNNVFNVASVTCDTLTNLVCITEDEEDPHILATIEKENMSDERGSETEHAFEMIDQGNVRDHNVTQIIMDVRDHEKDGETSTETIWISHQEPCDVLTENEELYKGQEHYSSNTSLTHSPTQDDAAKMLENEEVRKDKKETENTAVNDVTSKSEEMFSFEDSATDTGSHAQRQLFMQSPVKEGYDLHENLNEKHEKEEILFSVESENVAFDRGNERSEGTDGIKEMDAAPVLTLDVGDADLHLEIEAQNKTFDSNSEADGTEENISGASLLVRENKVTGNTVESIMTTELDFLQTSDAHVEASKVSENAEKEVSGETILKQSDINIIPDNSHEEEAHAKSSPVIQKRKMGSTRRPLKGNKGLRKGHDEKEIFNVEDEPSPDESRHTALSSCDISESQTFTKIHAGSKENTGDVDIAPAEGDTESHSENKTIYSPAFEGEATEENICAASDTSTDAKLESLISEPAENEISLKTDIISKQSVPNIIPEDLHGDEVHTKLNLNVHKRKMGSTRRPLKGNKGQRKGDDLSEVSEEKGMDNTGDDSNSLTEAIHLKEGTKDKFVMTVSHEDVHQIVLEPEQTENTHNVIPTQELRATQDDVVHENNSQKIPATQEKRRKMGSTRRNPGAMHGKNMADNEDVLVVAEDRETKKAEDGLEEELSISQSKDMSSVSSTDLDSEMLASVTDLKVENDHLNSSRSTVPETHENTLQICDNQLVNADVTKHPQSETVTIEKRRKMGSTRKNLREGGIRGKRDGHEDTEIEDTDLQMSQGSEMSLVREDVRQQTTHDYSNQPADSLLSEIERALNKTSLSSLSCDWELIVKEPNPDSLANAPDLNMPENSEIKSLQPMPSAHSAPNSPGRRRKMGSTRKNPRQQLNAEREEEDKEDGEIDENSKTNKQEKKDLERAEASVVHNITENKLNKEYLDVSSAHTSSNQLEETTNPVSQEKTSPSTKRKFGSRRANKSKQGLGRLADSDFGNELEDGDHKPDSSEVKDKLHSDDLAVCDPCLTLQPENQPASEQRNMEAKNEEAASKGTDAGLVSLDQIIKHDRTGAKQTVNLKNRISDTEVVQFNVVMVGNSCVGKTSFIRRFHEGQFTEDYRSTIGVDTFKETVELPDRTVRLQIWDTAGQERFHSITTQLFHKADGLLLMYDITCSKSFISVRDWISQARERAPDDVIMMLLGNKNDSVNREVQIQEGADLAREYNIHFMECSAAAGVNVSESMRSLAEMLVQRKSEKEKHTTLRREAPQKKSGCC
uniref:Ras-related protein Rab-12 n=1 Tax=Cyprinus carpio carpio TaxID=630221 RepID=A0A8C1B1J6_CYPCA